MTGEVNNSADWEKGFRTHGNLFKEYSATAIDFAATNDNEFAILWELDDVEKFLSLIESEATIEAMEFDGLKRETVKVYALDKVFDL